MENTTSTVPAKWKAVTAKYAADLNLTTRQAFKYAVLREHGVQHAIALRKVEATR